MATRGAPKGNNNAAKAKIWTTAIEKALQRRSRKDFDALVDLAEKLLVRCDEGDMAALKELGDRLEGKPAQTIQGDSDNPLITRIERVIKNA